MKINNKTIDENSPCYIIAEMSANHGGDINKAKKLIAEAKLAGVDAVKLQTYTADTITLNCSKPDFCLPSDNPWQEHVSLHSLYQKAFTPWEWHQALFEEAKRCEIDIFSSPFDESSVDLLESLNTPVYKIASPEITDIPLLKYVAATGKPVILSTGIAELADIELAVSTLRNNGCDSIAILKCTTAYPTPLEECNLATITDIAKRFNCIAGLSDHTQGIISPIVSVTLGAKIIEKHFIIDKSDDSVDAFFSLDKDEFSLLVKSVRDAEKAVGGVTYDITDSAKKNMLARRSLYFAKDLKKGHVITKHDIKSVRPGFGLHTKHFDDVLGLSLTSDVELGDRVSFALTNEPRG
ncbi:N-acetylneuraminate synthase [Pseudoalteromonas marina]|uniref:pseudaminic acid synthase n=1 Tax=Pseudoalteromonas marina TaxID=267375 RepID=UPI00026D0838|nr:pseudaminic acid synthase [Pseudoalteromonas marina]KAF7779758.1 N-acetylneuraminate synthase [Pseudoalteromonas marina]